MGVTRIFKERRQRHKIKEAAALFTIVIMHGPLKSEEETASSASILVTTLNNRFVTVYCKLLTTISFPENVQILLFKHR